MFDEMSSNFQFSANNGYSTDEHTNYLEEKGLDGYIYNRKLLRKGKSTFIGKPFQKDNFCFIGDCLI